MASFSLFLCLFGNLAVSLAAGCASPYVNIKGVKGNWCIYVKITAPDHEHSGPISWKDARMDCQTNNGDLVVLDSVEKFYAISKHLDGSVPETRRGYPFSVGASSKGGQWQWVDSSPVNLRSNIWFPNHPAVSSSFQIARLLSGGKHDRMYLSAYGDSSLAHICETH